MQSVAVPAGSLSNPVGAEADLARAAARSDAGAFAELFRRHAQPMWRLAQAVTPDPEAAATSVSEGFVRVLRSVRRRQIGLQEPLRPKLLAGTYRAALDALRRPEQAQRDLEATAESLHLGEREPDAALAMAAFRSLPERWRAAVWLHEVEGFEPADVAPVLGVSAAVASQLTARGHKGLLGRFSQAGMEAPEHLDAVLRPLALAVPAGLEGAATARWRKGIAADPAGRWVPATGWMSERALRPLSVASAGVLAIGLIGLGVLGQQTGVFTGSAIRDGGVPGQASGLVGSGGAAGGGAGGYGGLTAITTGGFFDSPLGSYLTAAESALYGAFGTTPTASLSGPGLTPSSSATGGTGATQAAATPPPATTPPPTGTSTPPPPSAPTVPTAPQTTTVLNAAPVATITTTTSPSGGSTATVTPLPGTTAPTGSVSVGTCTEVSLSGATVPVTCPPGVAPGTMLTSPTASTTTTTTTAPSLTGTVSGTLGGL